LVLALVAITVAAPARAAGPSTVTVRGDATHDNRVTGAPEPPLGVRWALDFGAPVSYPVVAGGTVFVTVRPADGAAYGTTAVAVDLATGAVRWTRPVGGTYFWSALAYGDGRLYLLNFDGRLSALSPTTGGTLWTTQLDQYSFSTAPVYHGGSVYLTGAGSGMTAYAVRASDGALQWSKSLPSGAGSPAVDDGTVYVSMVCQHAVALDRASGATRWARSSSCAGGGESTPALHGGRLYPLGDNGAIYDAATGATVGSADFQGAPGFADGVAYVPWQGGIVASDAATWATRWAAAGAGAGTPLISGSTLFTGGEGFVAALSRSDGAVRWCASTAGEPVVGETGNVDRPDSGLGAGEGVLLVPAGRFLVAYAPGGAAPLPCGTTSSGGGSSGGGSSGGGNPPIGPTLTLRVARSDVLAGHRVGLNGRLSNVPSIAGVGVRVEADPWPFDDRWKHVADVTSGPDGGYALRVRPLRNTRYRAQAGLLTSGTRAVYAELTARFRRAERPGRAFREQVTISGPRGTKLRATREHFYVVRARARVARRQASVRLRRVRPGVYRAAATLRALRRGRTTVLACYRERSPDPWGRAGALDARCGARRLDLPAPAPARATASIAAALPFPRAAIDRFTAAR
jgi:outer membrane protein assembly factor BamB